MQAQIGLTVRWSKNDLSFSFILFGFEIFVISKCYARPGFFVFLKCVFGLFFIWIIWCLISISSALATLSWTLLASFKAWRKDPGTRLGPQNFLKISDRTIPEQNYENRIITHQLAPIGLYTKWCMDPLPVVHRFESVSFSLLFCYIFPPFSWYLWHVS